MVQVDPDDPSDKRELAGLALRGSERCIESTSVTPLQVEAPDPED